MSSVKNILIVDDEPDIVELIAYNLQKEGYQVASAQDGTSALNSIKTKRPDLILLDWMIPEPNGIEVCKKLKADPQLCTIPIIMVSARGDEFDKVLALEIGADDYVSKPFSPRELVARVKALLRRASGPGTGAGSVPRTYEVLKWGDLTIDPEQYEAAWQKKPLALTKTEFELLLTLARKPERVFTREQLLYQVWGHDFYGDDRVVDVHVRRLRAKLEEFTTTEYVKTVRGVGYKFSFSL